MTTAAAVPSGAENATWELDTLVSGWGEGRAAVIALLDGADVVADELAAARGRLASMDSPALAHHMRRTAEMSEMLGRAHSWAALRFAELMTDEARGALVQMVLERATALETKLLFFDLEWAALDDAEVEELLADPALDFCSHHLRSIRRYRPHLLTEPEEKILAEKSVTGATAWARLFDELTSTISVELPATDGTGTHKTGLEEGLSVLAHPDREVRRRAAQAVTEGLAPGLRTRAYVFNTLLADKATDDRLRGYPSWISSRNLANEASDESVDALVAAVTSRYDIPQRWYALKARLLGIDRICDYDRMASVADTDVEIGWNEAKTVVLDAYGSFSGELASVVSRFFDGAWIDAPVRPGKRPGAFCSYTVPSHHPYVLLNWTGRQRDVLTLAHELGHGVHAWLAREQGVFHQSTPLTLAETASVFGETVTFGRLLDATSDAGARLSLLAESLEGSIATVFRQIAMNRFEDAVHNHRRAAGELSVDLFGEIWAETQAEMLGDAVEITDGYRTWWSYIPHFMSTPGYVYAYAYGQLLALSVYRQYTTVGPDFVQTYLELLAAGGSRSPEDLGQIVGVDLTDQQFWVGGLAIVEEQLQAAEAAARDAGRLT